MSRMRLAIALAVGLGCGCSSALEKRVESAAEQRDGEAAVQAYDRYRSAEGDDEDLLARVAEAVLAAAARSDDAAARDAALGGLSMAGGAGEPLLEELAGFRDAPAVRARALAVLAARGDRRARSDLRAMIDHADPAVVAAAVTALDPEDESGRLLRLLEHPSADVRAAAATTLTGAPPASRVRHALVEAARADPEPRVRASAVQALGGQGPPAVDRLRGSLSDASTVVRMAAVRALLRADPQAGMAPLARLLATPPSPAGIEAARMIRLRARNEPTPPDALVQDAGAYLVGAIRAGSGRLRAQAAVALVSLPPSQSLDAALEDVLRDETDPEVRLQLARAHLRRADAAPLAVSALEVIAEGDGMPAVQAAAELAERGNPRAVPRLVRALTEGTSVARAAAARALACRASRPDAAFGALADSEPVVRVHAASAILRCT